MVTLRSWRWSAALVVCGYCIAFWTHAQPLSVALGLNKPPYVMDNGQSGLEVDIVRHAFAAAALPIQLVQLPPARGLMLQRAGQLDVLLTIAESIGGTGHFSLPYVTYQNVAMSLSGRRLPVKQIEDLSAHSVAAFQNAAIVLGPRFSKVASKHPDYKEYPSQVTQNNLLYSGRVDVIVGDYRILKHLLTELDPHLDASQPVTIHPIFPPSPYKAVFKDAAIRDQFNQGLKIIQANGTYDALLKKYANLQ